MVTVVGDFGVRLPRFREQRYYSDTMPIRIEMKELREAVGCCKAAAAAPVAWRAWASSAFT